MILSIKKKSIIIAAIILVAIIATITTAIVVANSSITSGFNGRVVVIDAGHGGIDGGVVGRVTGLKEADINLAIARFVERNLTQKGYRVVMTRTTTEGLYGLATKNRKMRDMESRRNIINRANPDLVVSIHQNSFPSPTVSGAQVFFPMDSVGCSCCQAKAELMQNALNTALGGNKQARRGDFFIISSTPHPALLVESGFLSNPEEEKLLVTEGHQEKIAYTISTAIHFILSE